MSTPAPAVRADGEQSVRSGEIRSLTGLRAVAAAWVVVYHFHFTPGVGYGGYW